MKIPYNLFVSDVELPTLLIVGCGSIGDRLAKAYVEGSGSTAVRIYVTDSDKDRARKLSEYRLSSITPIRWKNAQDTPEDVDIIVVCVDYDSEHKLMDRLISSGKNFVSLTDSAQVFDEYLDNESEFTSRGIKSVLGTGLVPGISDILVEKLCNNFDQVLEISVEKLGFVSPASLASIKQAIKEQPLRIKDGVCEAVKGGNGSAISWFPQPYGATECIPVAAGIKALQGRYGDVHNISLRYAEPRLPTFVERLKNIFLHVPLTTTRACIRVQVHGVKDGEVKTVTQAVLGDAMTIIISTTILSIIGLHNNQDSLDDNTSIFSSNEVLDSNDLLSLVHSMGVNILRFDPILY